MIVIESKRKKPATILKHYPDAILADVTSAAKDDLVKLSPFYPHGGIPVPFSEGYTATCVEAIWQGLKVFENCGVDIETFKNDTMKNIKRTVRRYGKPLGHRKGVHARAGCRVHKHSPDDHLPETCKQGNPRLQARQTLCPLSG